MKELNEMELREVDGGFLNPFDLVSELLTGETLEHWILRGIQYANYARGNNMTPGWTGQGW